MWDILNYIGVGAFVVFFFGFCVFIHELGHFLAAKWRGLHIIAFSLGFKKVWGIKYKGVDYRIGCLPFGGYVDLPQIDASGEAKDEDGNVLPPAKPMDRIITAFAGPLFNILFGFALGCVIWYCGIPQGSPMMKKIEVASVEEGSPEYKAGLRAGDKVVAINGKSFYGTWNKLIQKIIFTVGEVTLTVEDKDGNKRDIVYQPVENKNNGMGEDIAYPFFTPRFPVVLFPAKGGAADKAGIKEGDKVLKLNGQEINSIEAFAALAQSYESQKLDLLLQRGKETLNISVNTEPLKNANGQEIESFLVGVSYSSELDISVKNFSCPPGMNIPLEKGDIIVKVNNDDSGYKAYSKTNETKKLELLVLRDGKEIKCGIELTPEAKDACDLVLEQALKLKIGKTVEGSAAAEAGLKSGDVLFALNGKTIREYNTFKEVVSKGREIACGIIRDGKKEVIKLTPRRVKSYGLGVSFVYTNYPSSYQQFVSVISMTYKSLRGVFYYLGNKMGFTKQKSSIKPKHFSGPLGIVRVISLAVYRGSYIQGLYIIVIITFSLGLLNLFPIPILDGGHIMLACLQMIFKKPFPAKILQPISFFFIFFLISFMLYVTYNDAWRVKKDLTAKTYTSTLKVKPLPAGDAPAAVPAPEAETPKDEKTPK